MRTTRTKLSGVVAIVTVTALSSVAIPAAADDAPTLGSECDAPSSPRLPLRFHPSPPPQPGVSRQTAAWGATGIALAGAAGATVFGVLALQNKSSYERGPTYANTDDANNFAAYADGCIALAAAAGLTSLVLFLTSPPADTAAPRHSTLALAATPVVTAHGGGVGAVLSF